MKYYKKETILILLICIICVGLAPMLRNNIATEPKASEENHIDSKTCYETTRYYEVDTSYPFLSSYDQQILQLTLQERAGRLADDAQVAFRKEDSGHYVASITLIYNDSSEVPSEEERDFIFETVTSKGQLQGIINYGLEDQEIVFDNHDVESSGTQIMADFAENGDVSYGVTVSLTNESLEDAAVAMAGEMVSLALDGAVISSVEFPVDEGTQEVDVNYLVIEVGSQKLMLRVNALLQTLPLKYDMNRINL